MYERGGVVVLCGIVGEGGVSVVQRVFLSKGIVLMGYGRGYMCWY